MADHEPIPPRRLYAPRIVPDGWDEDEGVADAPARTAPAPAPAPPQRGPEAPAPEPAAPPAAPSAPAIVQAASAPLLEFPLREPRFRSHFPEFFARSGIFAPGYGGEDSGGAIAIKAQGCEIEFDGPRLTMSDKSVWEAAVRLAKAEPPGASLGAELRLRELAAEMGWKDGGGTSLGWLRDSLSRLSESHVSFRYEGGPRGGGLLVEPPTSGRPWSRVEFDPAFVAAAFGKTTQFRIDCGRRRGLGSTLAQWLHDFLSTHSEARPLGLDYLMELSRHGGGAKHFPEQLRTALEELGRKAPELVAGWTVKKRKSRRSGPSATIGRGPEKPKFEMPANAAKKGQTTAAKPTPIPARRRGVQL